MGKQTVKNSVDFLSEMLKEIEYTHEKSAAEMEGNGFGEENLRNKGNGASLATEQAAAATEAGSTVSQTTPNTENDPEGLDLQAPKKLMVDDTVAGASDVIGTIKKEEYGMGKTARAQRLEIALLNGVQSRTMSKQASTTNPLKQYLEKAAADCVLAGDEYARTMYRGIVDKLSDVVDASKKGLDKNASVQYSGGVVASLDKIAMEAPEDVLPDDLVLEGGVVTGEGVPEEAMAEVGAGEDPAVVIDQLSEVLDQAGVTPEDIEETIQDLNAAAEAGISPDEFVSTVGEMVNSAETGNDLPKAASERQNAVRSWVYKNIFC